MRNHPFITFLSALTVLLAAACTTGYKLDPGHYTMTLKLENTDQLQPQKVFLEKQGDLVTIKNAESEEVLKGTLKKNQLVIRVAKEGKTIEFTGALVTDNNVQGNARQSSGEEEDFNADFTLVKVAD